MSGGIQRKPEFPEEVIDGWSAGDWAGVFANWRKTLGRLPRQFRAYPPLRDAAHMLAEDLVQSVPPVDEGGSVGEGEGSGPVAESAVP